MFAQVFCDFGDNFCVNNATGENALSAMVASITKEETALVACLDEARHGLETGDYVKFSEVRNKICYFFSNSSIFTKTHSRCLGCTR